MYGGFDVFKTYLAIKLHFTTDTYDFHKYEGKVNCKLDTFTKRNDRYFFHKLSTRYSKDDILGFFISNFLVDSNKWVGSLTSNDGKDVFMDWKKRKESFDYYFRGDCVCIFDDFNARGLSFDDGFRVRSGQHPRFLQLVLSKKISYETAVVFNNTIQYSNQWDRQINEKVVWPVQSQRLKKYEPFVKYNETSSKMILKEIFLK